MILKTARMALTGATALLCLSSSSAQISKVNGAYVFRVKFVAGSVLKYKSVVSTSLSNTKAAFSMPFVQTVVGVHHGVGDMVFKVGPLGYNGKPVAPAVNTRMSIDRRGTLVAGEASSSSGVTAFPEKPIHPGQTWKATVPINAANPAGQPTMVTTIYKFIRMTTVKGQSVAELGLTFREGGSMAIQGSGTEYILAKDGYVLKSSMKFNVTISREMAPVAVNAEVSRI